MRKRILVLTPRYPYPVIGGDRLRIFNICRELSKFHDLTLLSLCEKSSELTMPFPNDGVFKRTERVLLTKWRSYLNCLWALPKSVPLQIAYYRSNEFSKKLAEMIGEHDIVLSHLIRCGDYVVGYDNVPKILEMTDAISMNYERVKSVAMTGGIKNIIYANEQRRLRVYEENVASKFDFSILVSDVDRQYLYGQNAALLAKVIVCSNGVDVRSLPYQYSPREKSIVFIGNMTTVQNFDAALWFAQRVMPILLKQGDYSFKIVGKISPEKKAELVRIPGVSVTGRVSSVAHFARDALVGVCPMRLGAGVQNKILEYMALGLPTISSPLGLEGIDATVGKEILRAVEPEDYAELIVKLEADSAYARALSIAGRAFVEEHHNWSKMLAPILDRIEKM